MHCQAYSADADANHTRLDLIVNPPHPSAVVGYEGIPADEAIVHSLLHDGPLKGIEGPSLVGPRQFFSLNKHGPTTTPSLSPGCYYRTPSPSSSATGEAASHKCEAASTKHSATSHSRPNRMSKSPPADRRQPFNSKASSMRMSDGRSNTSRSHNYNSIPSIIRDYRNNKISAIEAQYHFARENPIGYSPSLSRSPSCVTSLRRPSSRPASSLRRQRTATASTVESHCQQLRRPASNSRSRPQSTQYRVSPNFVPRCAETIPYRYGSSTKSEQQPAHAEVPKKAKTRRSQSSSAKGALSTAQDSSTCNKMAPSKVKQAKVPTQEFLSSPCASYPNALSYERIGFNLHPVNLNAYRRMLVFPVEVPADQSL